MATSATMFVKLAFLLSFLSTASALWPIPRQLSTGNSTVRLASNFGIHANFAGAPSDLSDAISRTMSIIKTDQLAPLVIDRGESLVPTIQKAKQLQTLTLELSSSGANPKTTVAKSVPSISEEAVKAIGERDESYTLSVPGDGTSATIKANTTLGLLRGMTTFTQLLFTVDNMIFTSEAPVEITDSPAFVRFSLFIIAMILTFTLALQRIHARHCTKFVSDFSSLSNLLVEKPSLDSFPVSDIKRTLDAMSWSKVRPTISTNLFDLTKMPKDQPIPLARHRQPKLPPANPRFHGTLPKGCLHRFECLHAQRRQQHRVIRC